ncbi:MAG: ubiquinol-cytochrome c reductase iron-sulfur subunit [Pyrinomonadaceae bacterium]
MENCSNEKAECGGRREFLVKASALAGGLVLSLSGAARANEKTGAADEVVLKLDASSPLSRVGGFDTIDTKAGKVIVVRIGDGEFKAYSAVCPHKGGPISYDETSKQLVCSWHGSQFDMNGKVVKGPARADLSAYAAENEVVVTLTKSPS